MTYTDKGTYEDMESVWEAYPSGGNEGDYVEIGGVKFYWDVWNLNWLAAEPSASASAYDIEDTNNLGTYSTLKELVAAHPKGSRGDYATVGTTEWRWNNVEESWETVGMVDSTQESEVEETDSQTTNDETETSESTSEYSLTTNLGTFDNILKVWEKYENGGSIGDYLSIGGVTYVWNEYLHAWVAYTPTVTGRTNYKTHGDLTVDNNLYVGGYIRAEVGISQYDKLFQILIKTHKDDNKILTDKVYVLDKTISNYISGNDVDITSLKSRVSANETDIVSLRNSLGTAQNNIDDLTRAFGEGTGITDEQLSQLMYAYSKTSAWNDFLSHLSYDSTNNAIKCDIGFYSTTWISALGVSSSTSGGGSGMDLTAMWAALGTYDNNSAHIIDLSYLPDLSTKLTNYIQKVENGADLLLSSGETITKDSLLSGYAKTADLNIANWDAAYSNSHTHTNKGVLDNLTQSVIDDSHTHGNKTVLDGITSELIGHWNAAYTNSHTHDNKDVLDSIASGDVSNWGAAWTWVSTNKENVEALLKVLSIDSDGNLHASVGLYSDKFLSSLGVNSTTSGGSELDVASMWAALTTFDNNTSHYINIDYIPDLSSRLTDYYNKSEVKELIGKIPKFTIEVVDSLPTSDISNTTVYLVKTGSDTNNLYTE